VVLLWFACTPPNAKIFKKYIRGAKPNYPRPPSSRSRAVSATFGVLHSALGVPAPPILWKKKEFVYFS